MDARRQGRRGRCGPGSILVFGLLPLCWWTTGCVIGITPPPDDSTDDPLAPRSGSGSAAVRGVVRSANPDESFPIGGVRVAIGDAVAITNVDGTFALTGVPAGDLPLVVDGGAVTAGDGRFGAYAGSIRIAEAELRELDRSIYLPFLPLASLRLVSADAPTRVGSAGEVELVIAPGGGRRGGRPYDGEVIVQVVPLTHLPVDLPARVAGRTLVGVTVQPIDLEFPGGAVLHVSESLLDPAFGPRHLGLLRRLSEKADEESIEAVGIWEEGRWSPLAGGIHGGGWFYLTDMEVGVRGPCEATDTARSCLQAWERFAVLVSEFAEIPAPGAEVLLGRLNASLAAMDGSVERARAVVRVSGSLFAYGREALEAYADLYRKLEAVEEVRLALAAAQASCGSTPRCGSLEASLGSESVLRLVQLLDEVAGHVSSFGWRFDRLNAAARGLAPGYRSTGGPAADDVDGFSAAATEFNTAYAGFAPFSLPMDAYESLTSRLVELRSEAWTLFRSLSTPAADGASIQEVCEGTGGRTFGRSIGGFAPLNWGGPIGDESDCAWYATDRDGRTVSVPLGNDAWSKRLAGSPVLVLSARRVVNPLGLNGLDFGALSKEEPVHGWSLSAGARRSLGVVIGSDGMVTAGFSARALDGIDVASRAGFSVHNLPGTGSTIEVFAVDEELDRPRSYTLFVDDPGESFDFGQPVSGSLDALTRAAAILFDGTAGDRMVVERLCCGTDSALFSAELWGPNGSLLVQGPSSETGFGDYALPVSGGYRLVLLPRAGRFADFEVVLHPVSAGVSLPYVLGTDEQVALRGPGASAVFSFAGRSGTIVVEGLSAEGGLELVEYSLQGPRGVTVAAGVSLFFDGSSFSRRVHGLAADGVYEITFRGHPADPMAAGSFSFRVSSASREPADGTR